MFAADVDRVGFIDLAAFIIIIITNAHFLIFWVYLLCREFPQYKIVVQFTDFLRYIL